MDNAKIVNNYDMHNSYRNVTHLYKKSLHSSSNISSNTLINDVLISNSELNRGGRFDQVHCSTKSLMQNIDTNGMRQWKTSLSKIDPIAVMEKSLSTCSNCNNTQYFGLELFQRNECKCNLGISETQTREHTDSMMHKKGISLFGRTISSEDSSQEEKAGNRQLFRPKFSRTKHSNKNTYPMLPNRTCDEGVDINNEDDEKTHKSNVAKITFKTAKEQLLASNPAARRVLGTSRKAQGRFVSPMLGAHGDKEGNNEAEITDERLRHIDPKMVELIESEIIDKGSPIGWDDIAGLQLAKSVIQEAVVWPLLRPDIFTGLRRPPKGILLFGPPGTGKTLIGKCIASQCHATFFSISASSLTSKWIGDGEKMVRALFAVAVCHQPAVIFIDEIDSLLTQRSDSEHEATRRIKTEFLVQFDGAGTGEEDRLLVVGATNRPQELDEAARRRLVKRLYIPLPNPEARSQIITNLLRSENHSLSSQDIEEVSLHSEGYSGADMRSLCSEAAMGPVRAVPLEQIATIRRDKVRPVCLQDFMNALQRVRPSVSQDDLGQYVKWNNTYGQGF